MKSFLESSRYVVMLGVFGTLLAAVALYIFGFAGVGYAIYQALTQGSPIAQDTLKELSINLIQTIDLFLLATVLYIIALGLYELFIDDRLVLPKWLTVKTLDDLKARLLGVVTVILPVTFLGFLVDWKHGKDILWVALSIAAVMISIASVQISVAVRHKAAKATSRKS